MEVNRLLNDEITYELLIRGLATSGTVATKRTLLREALRLEKLGATGPLVQVNLETQSELTICNDKLGDLEEDIQNFNHGNSENEFKRISTRLTHILMRLNRLQCDTSDEDKRKYLSEWCKRLLDTLKNIIQQPILDKSPPQQLSQSLMDEPLLLLPELSSNSCEKRNGERGEKLNNSEATEIPSTHLRKELGFQTENHVGVGNPGTFQRLSNSNEAYFQRAELNRDGLYKPGSVRFQEPSDISFNDTQRTYSHTRLETNHPFGFDKQVGANHIAPSGNVDMSYSNRANSTMDLSTQLRNLQFSPRHNTLSSYSTPLNDRCDIYRWGIKYDGQTSLPTFLERLEEIRQSRGVTKDRLLQSAVELFEKDALLWYRMNSFTSWEDLVEKLREAFQPYDYENALWDEIRRRTQGIHEKVISYVSVMESLFRRLPTKPSEIERVRIIRRNMLPYIQTQMSLQATESLQDLIRTARMIEDTEWRVQKFCPPPTSSKNLMEPDLAYKSKQNYATVASVNVDVQRVLTEETKRPLCWNCGENDHKFRRCTKPKNIFCFRCGKQNVTSPKCNDCTKNLKARQ